MHMATPAYLLRLMHYVKLTRVTLGPEDLTCMAFVTELRAATLGGRLRAVWTHPANELAGLSPRSPRPMLVRAAIARALGLITGSSDYLFLWEGGSLAMEFKSDKGSLTDGQRDFRSWCADMGVPFHVVRSASAGLQILRDAGVLA
ncbi:hypothetical protein UFOVP152_28 [uncultured Caudovirales phage]|uniref:VRR-NUC domain containing protein n=1 Tax=uncultured Caudovirales phage TaxID=2100421 RepID=A0A6J7WDQ1_9CAUD|nr:hypothetical protein UFOVP152_28 [uncultured Caudovirales phage]